MNVQSAHILLIKRSMHPPRPAGRRPKDVNADSVGGRLRALRLGAKLSQEDLADALNISRTMVTKYESGAHDIPDHALIRAEQVFGVTAAFIRYGDTQSRMAAVIGFVGAGAEVEASELSLHQYVEVPAGWADAIAYEVRGLSCWPVYEEGDRIVIRGEQRLQPEEFLGKMSVVETSDGLGFVKRVRRGSTFELYTLESPNAPPIEDVRLSSARPVRLHLPR